jgi:short-subunit dehydrogenase
MVVVITGASAGIGRALAVVLHGGGAKLALAARRGDKLEQLNAELGGGHLCVTCDVAEPTQCHELIRRAHEHFGRLDTVVCNAGYGVGKRVHETTTQEMLDIFRTNVFGTHELMRAVTPIFQSQEPRDGWRGQLMLVSSAAARRGLVYFGAYSATKAAQLSLAEAARVELEKDRIAVTSVHPVTTSTEFFAVAEARTGKRINVPGRTPLSQTAEQVARAMARGISNPAREVWPHAPSRLLLGLASLAPVAGDKVMREVRKTMDRKAPR